MDYARADLQADLVDELREEIDVLKKKIGDHSGINDIFLSITSGAKVLKKWQYQELTITDAETSQEYVIYIVNKESIDALKMARKLFEDEKLQRVLDSAKADPAARNSYAYAYLEDIAKYLKVSKNAS